MVVVKRGLRGLLWLWRCGSCGRCYRPGEGRRFTSSAPSCRDTPPFNILFLGTDGFALETLKALHLNRLSSGTSRVVDTLHVISTSAKTPVANFARTHDLTLLTWPPDLNDLDLYDLGVLVSFGRMVPRKVIAKFPHGILNAHPSLLPRWRGASPVLHTVLNADQETGVSIISIQPSYFDRGPLLQQERLTVPPDTTAQSLTDTLALRAPKLLLSTLQAMPHVLNTATPQAETGVTHAHKLKSSAAWVNWEGHSMQQIKQQYLALGHTLPLRSSWNQQTVKLLDMALDTDPTFTPSLPPPSSLQHRGGDGEEGAVKAGAVTFDPQLEAVCVKCMDGWVAFRSLVLRKPMSATDFYNGFLSKGKQPHIPFLSVANGLFDSNYWDFVQQSKARAKS